MVRKRALFDEETWQAIDLLGKDSLKDCEEFADLLKKHHRPVGLTGSLRHSVGGGSLNREQNRGLFLVACTGMKPRPPRRGVLNFGGYLACV